MYNVQKNKKYLMLKFISSFVIQIISLKKEFNLQLFNKKNLLFSYLGSFLGIYLIVFFHLNFLSNTSMALVIGSFGASAVLLYALNDSPLAQPRNLILGHILSAIIGVTSYKLFSFDIYLCAAFAVSTSILIMQLTSSLHPPGGATALIAVIGGDSIYDLGYFYVLAPILSSSLILLIIALIINNIQKNSQYPINIKNNYKNR